MAALLPRRSFLANATAVALGAVAAPFVIGEPAVAAPQSWPDNDEALSEESAAVTDLEGIHAEYRSEVAAWPLELPDGYTLPVESSLVNPAESRVEWELGAGRAEALENWTVLTAFAAYAAQQRGDERTARASLSRLSSAYRGSLAKSVVDDPQRGYLVNVLMPAIDGSEYGPLVAFHALDALDTRPALAAAAKAAGDL